MSSSACPDGVALTDEAVEYTVAIDAKLVRVVMAMSLGARRSLPDDFAARRSAMMPSRFYRRSQLAGTDTENDGNLPSQLS